jgi:hypothetical protein
MSTTIEAKAKKHALARVLLWVTLLIGFIGGSATRTTPLGRWIGHLLTKDGHAWVPIAAFLLFSGLLIWTLIDKTPDLGSMLAALVIPSTIAPFSGGWFGWALNFPWQFLDELISGHMYGLFGDSMRSLTDLASLCWCIALTVGAISFVRWARKRKGGKKSSDAASDLFAGI